MGMEQTVRFDTETIPSWESVRDFLNSKGYPVQMRMIDNELAFPEEAPPEDWKEIRVGTPQGMITLRRQANAIVLITWGNADEAMQQGWNALTWIYAKLGDGHVTAGEQSLSPEEYQASAVLPESLRN